jgi:hypothetical protein
MQDFLIAFLITFLGGIVAQTVLPILSRWAQGRFTQPKNSFAVDPPQRVPKVWLLRAAVTCLVAAYAGLIAFVAILILALGGLIENGLLLIGSAIGVLFLGFTTFLSLASIIRCPKCSNHILLQWTTQPPYEQKFKGFQGGIALAIKLALNKPFQCMYCGQHFFVRWSTSLDDPCTLSMNRH